MQIALSAVFPAPLLLSLLICVVCGDRGALFQGVGGGLGLSCQPQDLPEVNDPPQHNVV